MPYDRVASWDQCSISTSNQAFTNALSPQRYNTGALVCLPVMVTNTVLSATASQLTRFAYTDQGHDRAAHADWHHGLADRVGCRA